MQQTNQNNTHKQSGFIVLMGLLLLILGASVWFGTAGSIRSESMNIAVENVHIRELQKIKEKMLAFAVLNPELYNSVPNRIPGPGYFPCPDTDGDGNSDQPCITTPNELFAFGMVPQQTLNGTYSFLSSSDDIGRYWYAVDARFLVHSQNYAFNATTTFSNRFAPLNSATPTQVPNGAGVNVDPITLDGVNDIVMVLFYAGPPLAGQTRPARPSANYATDNRTAFLEQVFPAPPNTAAFNSIGADPDVFNDYVIPITRNEWDAAVLSRVNRDVNLDNVPDLCTVPVANDHWFNDCTYVGGGGQLTPYNPCTPVGGAPDNIEGQNWRSLFGCPP